MQPILFTIPILNLPVWSYGVMLGLSCVVGAHMAVYLAERIGIKSSKAWWFCLTVILVGIAGARLHELAVTGGLGAIISEGTKLQHSGRTAYGGYLSAFFAGILIARYLEIPFWRMADAVAPAMALGLGLTRIGCFLYGCDYGLVSEDYGVSFPNNSPAWTDQHYVMKGADGAPLVGFQDASLRVLPSQLYASAAGLILFALLIKLWFRRPRRDGTIVLSFFLVYGIVRAILEQLRSDLGRGELMGLSTSTTIGLTTSLIGAVLIFVPVLARMRGDAPPVLPPPDPEAEDDDDGKQKGKG